MENELIIKIDDNLYKRFEYIILLQEDPDIDLDSECFETNNEIELEIFDKKDIQLILKCESDKALRFLKFIFSVGYGIKIGRNYYVKREDFYRFFTDYKGREVAL